MSYLFPFSYCSWGSQGKNTEVVCHSLLHWTTFCQNSTPWPSHLGWPYTAQLSFIELDKAVAHVIRLTSFLWLWFQSVCPLMPSLNAYYLSGFSLALEVGYLFTAAPAKCSHCSLSWTMGISSLATPPDLEHGVAPLGPPAPKQPPLLGRGVTLLGCASVPPLQLPCFCAATIKCFILYSGSET